MSDSVDALIHFFNDIVAQVIPGYLSLLMISYSVGEYESFVKLPTVLLIVGSYVIGHILLSLRPIIRLKVALLADKLLDRKVEFGESFEKSASYKKYREMTPDSSRGMPFHDTRSVAMTLSAEGASLGRRFMFLSLFCQGASFSLMLLGPFVITRYLMESHVEHLLITVLIVCMPCVYLFLYPLELRAKEFYGRAMKAPFSCAIAKIIDRDL